jgi:hypothetical protein
MSHVSPSPKYPPRGQLVRTPLPQRCPYQSQTLTHDPSKPAPTLKALPSSVINVHDNVPNLPCMELCAFLFRGSGVAGNTKWRKLTSLVGVARKIGWRGGPNWGRGSEPVGGKRHLNLGLMWNGRFGTHRLFPLHIYFMSGPGCSPAFTFAFATPVGFVAMVVCSPSYYLCRVSPQSPCA